MMIKQVCLLKRHPSLTSDQFRDYYERVHAAIGEKHLKGRATRYLRRYLVPLATPVSGGSADAGYDVITEVWYADHETLSATMAYLGSPDVIAEIVADEERLFDRSQNRFYTVEEHETPL